MTPEQHTLNMHERGHGFGLACQSFYQSMSEMIQTDPASARQELGDFCGDSRASQIVAGAMKGDHTNEH